MLRLKFERTHHRLSQTAVARAANVAQPYVSQIERGRMTPTEAELARLAKVFKVAPDDLLKEIVVIGGAR